VTDLSDDLASQTVTGKEKINDKTRIFLIDRIFIFRQLK